MTLRQVPVPIPLGGGVDEATSDVLFEAPLVREAVNARIPKTGQMGKRFGEDALPASLPSTSTYGEHNAIAEHEGRAVVLTQRGLYLHDAPRATWAQAGGVQPFPSQVKVDPLVRQNNSSTEPEIALVTVGGRTVACIAWHDPEIYDGFYMFAEVPSDGGPLKVLSGPTKFQATSRQMAMQIRLAVIGTTVYAIAGNTAAVTDTWATSCNVTASYTFNNVNTFAWGATSVPVALLSDNSAALWAILDESGGGYSIRKLDTSFAQTASQIVAGADALDAIRYATTLIIIKGDGSIDDCADSLAGAPTNHPLVTVNVNTGPLFSASGRATICEAGSGTFFAAWERTGSATEMVNHGVLIASISAGYALTASGTVGTLRLAGRAALAAAEGVPLLPCLDSIDQTLWRMGFICRPVTDAQGVYTLTEVARFGQDLTVRQGLSRSFTESSVTTAHACKVVPSLVRDAASGQWLLPYQMLSDGTTVFYLGAKTGIDIIRLRTTDAPALRNVQGQQLRMFAGGAGVSYTDGVCHAELTPPPILLIDAPAVTGATPAGDPSGVFYNNTFAEVDGHFIFVPRWRDERGNLHRGVPLKVFSGPAWDQRGGVPNDEARRFRFPRPFPNSIRGDRGGQTYEIEVYAGETSSGPFYFFDVVTPEPHPLIGGVDYILIDFAFSGGASLNTAYVTDGIDHVAAVPGAVLTPPAAASYIPRWTDAPELAHVPPPACLDICSTEQRVWLLSAENGRLEVFPSKLLTPGYAPEFPTALRIVLPDEGGEATAIAALGDKILVFKERRIYAVFGSPGDNTGAGGNVVVRLIPGDVGCKEPQSVVEGPFGVVFRSAAGGFHLVSPGETVTRLPALEDSLADYAITGGVLVADRKEVRWSLALGSKTGRTLVWDYEVNAWMTHELAAPTVHACTVGGVHTRIAYLGSVYAERESWSTTLDSYALKMTSAWLKFSGSEMPLLKGFKRVWKTVLMLRWYSGDLIVRVGYNYETSYTDSRTWTVAELTALAAADGLVHLEVQHTRQKCEAVRFQLEESNPGGQTPPPRGAGFTVLGAVAEVGVKPGGSRPLPGGSRK